MKTPPVRPVASPIVVHLPRLGIPSGPTGPISTTEARAIAQAVDPHFARYVGMYDTAKYPTDVYQDALAHFRHPTRVPSNTIREALLWKYGHLGKRAIPQHHERLIAEVQSMWPETAAHLPDDPREKFATLDQAFGGRTRFITVAFLLHLLSPHEVPIIDQHNFRAVNALMAEVRRGWITKKKPSRYSDIALIAQFMEAILAAWGEMAQSSVPERRDLDWFLMMYGKALKRAS